MRNKNPHRIAVYTLAACLCTSSVAFASPHPEPFLTAQAGAPTSKIKNNPNKNEEIAALELEIAKASAQAQEASQAYEMSAEDVARAQDGLTQAEKNTKVAHERASVASEKVREARTRLGALAAAVYREQNASLGAYDLLSDEQGFRRAAAEGTADLLLSSQADAIVQELSGLEHVAKVLQDEAEHAQNQQEQALKNVSETAKTAREAAEQALEKVNEAKARKDQTIAALARAREVSLAQERARQERIEKERQEREAQAAQAELERRAREQQAAEQARQAQAAAQAQAQRRRQEQAEKAAEEALSRAKTEREREQAEKAAQEARRLAQAAQTPVTGPQNQSEKADSDDSEEPDSPQLPSNLHDASTPSTYGASVLDFARSKVGTPYVWGGATDSGYDCSGLIYAGIKSAGGTIARSSAQQYKTSKLVPFSAAQPGDLIFWSSNGTASGVYHVAVYAGGGKIVHAPRPGDSVREISLYNQNLIMPYVGRI